jgi:hypothetical protein
MPEMSGIPVSYKPIGPAQVRIGQKRRFGSIAVRQTREYQCTLLAAQDSPFQPQRTLAKRGNAA